MKNLKIKTALTSTQTDCDVSVNKLTVFWYSLFGLDELDSDQLLDSSLSRFTSTEWREAEKHRAERRLTQLWCTIRSWTHRLTELLKVIVLKLRWTSPFSLILHQIITQLLPLLETERIQSVCTSQASVDFKHDLLLVISSPVKTKLKRSQSDSDSEWTLHRIWVYSFCYRVVWTERLRL